MSSDQQQVITNLVTVDSEQRLGQTLLQLARTLGKKDPRSIRIELKIFLRLQTEVWALFNPDCFQV
jgi:hypothetical protein